MGKDYDLEEIRTCKPGYALAMAVEAAQIGGATSEEIRDALDKNPHAPALN